MIRVYRINDPNKVIFQSDSRDKTPYRSAVDRMRHFLKMRFPLLALKAAIEQADDKHLEGSDYETAARQLIHLVFRASGYDLQLVEPDGDGEMICRYDADKEAL